MSTLAFCDVESTGLDPRYHEVWEVGLILERPGEPTVERVWQLPIDLGKADAVALSIGRFYERRYRPNDLTSLADFAWEFSEFTHGAHLVGAVPSFDDGFLKRLLRDNGACYGLHYHLVDVEALAAGWLAGRFCAAAESENTVSPPPWDSNELSRAVGVNPEDFERHTALGDCQWSRAIYRSVMGLE